MYELNWDFYQVYFSPSYICFEILLFDITLKLQELSTEKQILWRFSLYILRYSPHKTEFDNFGPVI
jgi:hypothetical protein